MKSGTKFTPEQMEKLRLCIDGWQDSIDKETLRFFMGHGLVKNVGDVGLTFAIDLTSKGLLALNIGYMP